MQKLKKKDVILLSVSAVVLTAIITFVAVFWDTTYSILSTMLNGMDLVQDYIQGFGIIGIIVMVLIIVLCYFFPVISSMPIQIACGIAYGLFGGTLIVLLAFFIATQLLYLFKQNLKIFASPKQIQKKQELEQIIKESSRNIYVAIIIAFLLPAVPLLVISNLAASGLKYWKYTLVTTLGMIPDILLTIFLGEKLLSTSPVASIITLIAVVVIITLSIIFNDKLIRFAFAPKKKNKPASGDDIDGERDSVDTVENIEEAQLSLTVDETDEKE